MEICFDSLPNQIYKTLREDILLGVYPPGEKLLLRNLQERFKVSNTPIREALTRLVQDRYAEHISNQGVRVTELSAKDVEHLLDLRCACDCLAVEKVIELPDKRPLIRELQEAIQKQIVFSQGVGDSQEEYSLICYGLHNTLCRYTENPWLIECTTLYNDLLFLADSRTNMGVYPIEAIDEHKAIVDAIITGDKVLAISAVRRHREQEGARFAVSM